MRTESLALSGSKYRDASFDRDADQLERKRMAIGSWAEGQCENAVLILESVLSEDMSEVVAAECYVAHAAFKASLGLWRESMGSLEKAAPFIDKASVSIRGSFFHQRARAHTQLGNPEAAFTDYTGAVVCWQESGETAKVGAAELNLAGLCLVLGLVDSGLEHVDRAIVILRDSQSDYLTQAYDTKAQLLLAQDQINPALDAINTALELPTTHLNWRVSFLITRAKIKMRSSVSAAKRDFDEAIDWAEQHSLTRDLVAACCEAIKTFASALPLSDLAAYFLRAEPYGGTDLVSAARAILASLPNGTIEETEVDMVRRALIKCDGSITRAAEIVKLTHKGVDCVINRHADRLLHLRRERLVRHKSLIGKK